MLPKFEKERLRELQAEIYAKRRYTQPPVSEADEWVKYFEDVDDEFGDTVEKGIPVWMPKAECDKFDLLRAETVTSA
jgi:hypothetical protein